MARSYTIQFANFIRQLLPPQTRSPKNRAWLRALLKPVEELNTEMVSFVDDARYRANVTGQVISLEDFLNRTFDPTERRIIIIDGNLSTQNYDYFDNEGQTLDFMYFDSEPEHATKYTYFADENDVGFSESFRVFIPSSLSSKTAQITAEVNKYRLAGKDFQVTT